MFYQRAYFPIGRGSKTLKDTVIKNGFRFLIVFLLMVPTISFGAEKILNSTGKVVYRIVDNNIVNRSGKVVYRIQENGVYDRQGYLVFKMYKNRLYDRNSIPQLLIRSGRLLDLQYIETEHNK